VLERVLEAVIESGKTVTLAVQAAVPLRPEPIEEEEEESAPTDDAWLES